MKTPQNLPDAQQAVDGTHEKALDDPNRPSYHAICPANWMNDPNGPLVINGEVHIFYQHQPFSPEGGSMYWGHFKSRDLVHWEQLPIAFGPSFEKGEDGCWSGCCVIDPDGKPVALYTSVGLQRPALTLSEQWLVRGSPDMLHWHKDPNNPVMTQKLHSSIAIEDWRDPFAWQMPDSKYYCVLGGHIKQKADPNDNPSAFLYHSSDLIHWEFLHPLCSRYTEGKDADYDPDVRLGTNWECPNFFPVKNLHCLIVSVNRLPYVLGEYKDNKFQPKRWHLFDHGSEFYASHTFLDMHRRRIVIGWVRLDGGPAWKGCLSLPRVVGLRPDLTLSIEPLPELQKLRAGLFRAADFSIEPHHDYSLMQQIMEYRSLELTESWNRRTIELELEIGSASSPVQGKTTVLPPFQINIYPEEEAGIQATLAYDPEDAGFACGMDLAAFQLEPGEKTARLHMFIDRTVMEVFINRRWTLTKKLNPKPTSHLELRFIAPEERVDIKALQVWGIESIGI